MKYENKKMEMVIEVYEYDADRKEDNAIFIGIGYESITLNWKEFWSLLSLMNKAAVEVRL